MPIERGQEWGYTGTLPATAPLVSSDAALASCVDRQRSGPVTAAVDHGDLARTLGVRPPYNRDGSKQLLPVDVLHVILDGDREHVGVAHVVVGRLLWQRRSLAVMNAAFLGERNIAPRSHPGDGKADVITLDLGFADRIKARRRMTTGTHIPHPGIQVRRTSSQTFDLERPQAVRIDGVSVGRASIIEFTLEPNLLVVAV